MKGPGTVCVILIILVAVTIMLPDGSTVETQQEAQFVSHPTRVDDEATIRKLVQEYYAALRAEDYEQAVTFYAAGTFDDFPMEPARALKLAHRMTGSPEQCDLYMLRIMGDEASGELGIQRQGIGPAEIIIKDAQGNRIATWAKTLHFVREHGTWKLAEKEENTAGIDMSGILNRIQE